MISRHLDLAPPRPANGWRNIAIGTWRTAKDPSVYGVLELNVEPALAHLRLLSERTGTRLTVTHLVGKALAEAIRRHPEVNGVLRMGRIYPRRGVTVFFQVATDAAGEDLSGVTVRDAEAKSVQQIAAEMATRVDAVRDRTDRSYALIKRVMTWLPGFAARFILDLSSFLQYELNLWSPLLGTPRDPMGSVMVTNIGSLGLDLAFAPLVPYSRVPLVVAVGAARDQVVAEGGLPVVRKMLRLCVTFDHRLIDGVHAAKLAKVIEGMFKEPAAFDTVARLAKNDGLAGADP